MAGPLRCSRCGERKDLFVRISSLATLVRDDSSSAGLSIDISEKTPADYEWLAFHCGRCGHEGPRQDFEPALAMAATDPAIPAANGPPSPGAMAEALEAFVRAIDEVGGCVRLPSNLAIPQDDGTIRFGRGEIVPDGDWDWMALADAYLQASRALGREPMLRTLEGDRDSSGPPDEDLDEDEDAEDLEELEEGE
jgi:hypothetical protein